MVYQLLKRTDVSEDKSKKNKDSDAPLSISCLALDTITGTYHAEGSFSSSTSSPCIARLITSSFPSGGGGTCGSHAMLMKTLRPLGTGIGLGFGSRRFNDGGSGGGGRAVGVRDDDFMQKPAFGARSMRTVEDMSFVHHSSSTRATTIGLFPTVKTHPGLKYGSDIEEDPRI
jgi:hypothetical protein